MNILTTSFETFTAAAVKSEKHLWVITSVIELENYSYIFVPNPSNLDSCRSIVIIFWPQATYIGLNLVLVRLRC